MAKVFISYSHDSDLHERRIHDLAAHLRTHALDVIIDQDQLPGGPDEGWDHWSETQVRTADKVLIACTESYGVGLGSIAEARLIHTLIYKAAGINPKFRVVLFQESDAAHVPDSLYNYHRFPLYHPAGLQDLIAWLASSPPTAAPQPRQILWPPPATPHTWDMANRRDITERLEQMLTGRSPKRILLLSAASNSGKTHLLVELKAYAKRLPIAHASLDCKGELPLDELINLIALDLQNLLAATPSAKGADRRTALISDLQQLTQPVLLTFDTYEQASLPAKNWIENQLLPRLDNSPGVVAVIAGQQVANKSRAPLAEEMKLEPITKPSDWLEYSRRKWQSNVKLDHIEALLATNGNPSRKATHANSP